MRNSWRPSTETETSILAKFTNCSSAHIQSGWSPHEQSNSVIKYAEVPLCMPAALPFRRSIAYTTRICEHPLAQSWTHLSVHINAVCTSVKNLTLRFCFGKGCATDVNATVLGRLSSQKSLRSCPPVMVCLSSTFLQAVKPRLSSVFFCGVDKIPLHGILYDLTAKCEDMRPVAS